MIINSTASKTLTDYVTTFISDRFLKGVSTSYHDADIKCSLDKAKQTEFLSELIKTVKPRLYFVINERFGKAALLVFDTYEVLSDNAIVVISTQRFRDTKTNEVSANISIQSYGGEISSLSQLEHCKTVAKILLTSMENPTQSKEDDAILAVDKMINIVNKKFICTKIQLNESNTKLTMTVPTGSSASDVMFYAWDIQLRVIDDKDVMVVECSDSILNTYPSLREAAIR